jgi:hypothetical protein
MIATTTQQSDVLTVGLAVSACGEAVRPEQAKAQAGKTRRSRESLLVREGIP